MSALDDIKTYYANLLLYQFVDKTKAKAHIKLLAEAGVCDFLALNVRDGFNINTAVGNQLDILGKYIGFSRRIRTEIERDYFEFDDYQSPNSDAIGMTDYTSSENSDSVFYRYIFSQGSFLDASDEELRLFLKLKILLNILDNTTYSIDQYLYEFFGTDIIFMDNQDMTCSYYVLNSSSYIVRLAVDQNLLPKPMGVTLSGVFTVDNPDEIFGFSDYTIDNGNGDIGFSDYDTGFVGVMLRYQDKIA